MGKQGRDGGRRERARQVMAEQERAQARRARLVRWVGAGVVGLLVVGVVGVAVAARSSVPDAAAPQANPLAVQPASTLPADDPLAYGVPYGSPKPGAPVLEVWEDFQCPACAAVKKANGGALEALAEAGRVRLVWRPTTFLDANLRNDASVRAASAWGCAIDQGVTREFHDVVFANQPEREGEGYTDEQLIGFGAQVGLAGADLEEFTGCVKDGTYAGWARNSTAVFADSQIPGTPHALLDGTVIENSVLADPVALQKAIDAATAKVK